MTDDIFKTERNERPEPDQWPYTIFFCVAMVCITAIVLAVILS